MNTNTTITFFSQRRITEVGILLSSIVLFAYGWQTFINADDIAKLNITTSIVSLIIASVTVVLHGVIRALKTSTHIKMFSLISYAGSVVLSLSLLIDNNVSSPYVGFWFFAALSAAYYGIWGYIISGALAFSYSGWLYYNQVLNGSDSILTIAFTVFVVFVPVILSGIIWGRHSSEFHKNKDKIDSAQLNGAKHGGIISRGDMVLEAIADGVLMLDAKGNVDVINPAAQRILGWNRKDSIGINYKSILKVSDMNNHEIAENEHPIERCLLNNQPEKTSSIQLETASGKKIVTSLIVSPAGSTGQSSGVIVIFRDITKEQAEEREQAEFISTASHEMRTPVASIEGYLGLALNPQTATIDEKARTYIQKAQESAHHLGQLFQDLLDVTRADDGRLNSKPKVTDIVDMAHEICTELLSKATKKNVRIDYKPMPDLYVEKDQSRGDKVVTPVFYVNVDPGHLREVLTNLIDNAIKYTPKGNVTINIEGNKKSVTFSVEDTGIGIPKEDIPHLFQKFYRVDNTDTREIGGTGLGLYLSRRLIESMEGRLWVDSIYKQGSTFFVELPRMDNISAQKAIEQAAVEAAEAKEAKEAEALQEQSHSGAISQIKAPTPTQATATAPTQPQAPTQTTTQSTQEQAFAQSYQAKAEQAISQQQQQSQATPIQPARQTILTPQAPIQPSTKAPVQTTIPVTTPATQQPPQPSLRQSITQTPPATQQRVANYRPPVNSPNITPTQVTQHRDG